LPLMERLYFDERAAAGYMPNITLVEGSAKIVNGDLIESVSAGSIVIEHNLIPEGYSYRVISNPTPEERTFYSAYAQNITCDLPRQLVQSISSLQFASTISFVRDLLNDSIPEWETEALNIPSYKPVESRLEYE
jgi:hypothetical protein